MSWLWDCTHIEGYGCLVMPPGSTFIALGVVIILMVVAYKMIQKRRNVKQNRGEVEK